MKNFMNGILDAIGTIILMAIAGIAICFAYTIMLPIGAIVKSCMDGELLSDSWVELHQYFISKLNDI